MSVDQGAPIRLVSALREALLTFAHHAEIQGSQPPSASQQVAGGGGSAWKKP